MCLGFFGTVLNSAGMKDLKPISSKDGTSDKYIIFYSNRMKA